MRGLSIRLDRSHLLKIVSDSVFPGFGVAIEREAAAIALCRLPVAALRFDGSAFAWHRVGYSDFAKREGGILATGQLTVESSTIELADQYEVEEGTLRIRRSVSVHGTSAGSGFLTAFEWRLPGATLDDPWFAPGVWYNRNQAVPDYAIGAPQTRSQVDYLMFREDRLTLPFALHYSEPDERALALIHLGAVPVTVAADDADAPLIDERLQFGSFGMYENGRTLAFWFPGTEGETLYPPMWTVGRGNDQGRSPVNPFAAKAATNATRGWVHRYHPLREGFTQRYELATTVQHAVSYREARDRTWSLAFARYRPRVRPIDLGQVQCVSVALLRRLVRRAGGAIGIPTWIDCFTGRPGELQNTFGIGFVARNLEAACILIAAGHREQSDADVAAGREIVDFWTTSGGRGLSHTEFEPRSASWIDGGQEAGRRFVFLRDESEAHRSCLHAWLLERSRGADHPGWLEWVQSYARWLREKQNPDGSFYRSYDLDGVPVAKIKADCAHVIPFLLEVAGIENDASLLAVAENAADYLWESHHEHDEYLGGTLDNPICYDKESSAIAFEAYLLLFEANGNRRWLDAAERAARVCETWIFQWDIPAPCNEAEHRFFGRDGTTVGFQLITTGFSAFDMYLTRHVGDFARLARHTGERHWLDIARILLYNPKSTVQLADEYGYAYPGLQIEHWSAGRGRGYGLNSGWLPWVATSHVLSIEQALKENML